MYLETIQDVLAKTSKILVTGKDGQNQLLYLPIDKLMNNSNTEAPNNNLRASSLPESLTTNSSSTGAANQKAPRNIDLRARGSR